MSVPIRSSVLKSGREFYGSFVRYHSWQCRSVCQVHSLCRGTSVVQHTVHRPLANVAGLGYFRSCITPTHLPNLSSGVRWFSDNERDEDGNRRNQELKGFVFHVPNPLAWLKDKWYTYRIQSLVDPLFSLGEFQVGAKQALSFLTRLMVMKDFETLKTVASEEVVEKIQQLFEDWSSEQQQSVEILVDDISVATAAVTSLVKDQECYVVSVDFLCIAVKRYKTRPLLVSIGVRFVRQYGTVATGDWLISDIREFQVRELATSKGSDQRSN